MLSDDWIQYYLGMAEYVSRKSKDPSTKIGAVLVRPDKSPASAGFNGFPQEIEDKQELLLNRNDKLNRIIHGEMNAILFCRDTDMSGYSLFVYPFIPCSRCAVHVIQKKISYVYGPIVPKDSGIYQRWNDDLELSRALFKEAGVICKEVPFKKE